VCFWTAGQRVDPSIESTFIWRVATENGNRETPATYTNWRPGRPDYYRRNEACMVLQSWADYKWNDVKCETFRERSVCEIDILPRHGFTVAPETGTTSAPTNSTSPTNDTVFE